MTTMTYTEMIVTAPVRSINGWRDFSLTTLDSLADADRVFARSNNLALAAACSAMAEEHYNAAMMG